MDLTETQVAPPAAIRRPGPDVVRAIAMLGVITVNYHGYLILRGAPRGGGVMHDLFDPWTGPLSTRFAATFVLTAGVGVTLLTSSSIGDRERIREQRWRLARRGLLLYGTGLLFDLVWEGTILPFYGAMFVIAALLFTLSSGWVLLVGAASAVAGWLLRWWSFERARDGDPVEWLTERAVRSPRQLLIDVFVNGTHPLLPWLAFLSAGIVIGRLLTTARWRQLVMVIGLAFVATALIVDLVASGDRGDIVFSNDPFERGVVFTASTLGTATLAFAAISWLADRYASTPVVDNLRRAGQMSLSIYLAHGLLFNLLVDWLDIFDPVSERGIATALVFTAVVWVSATAAAIAYQRRFGRGPAEVLYRRLAG